MINDIMRVKDRMEKIYKDRVEESKNKELERKFMDRSSKLNEY